MKKWLRAQPIQPTTIADLQTLLDTFREEYNQRRPHRSLEHRSTPAVAHTARPKATPSKDRSRETHDRVRTDKIDHVGTVTLRHNGRLHHIGIGRTHARTYVRMLVQDEPPRQVRRLHSLGRLESCQGVRRRGTRPSCVSGRSGWSPKSGPIMSRSGRR